MWYEKYGWKKNPFFVRPDATVIGMNKEKKEIENYVNSETISSVTGPYGSGKTNLLLWLLNKTKKRIIYLNGIETNTPEKLNKELAKKRTILEKLTGKKYPKNLVVLLDEAQAITDPQFFEIMRTYWDSRTLKSIVVASSEKINLSPGLESRLGERIICLNKTPSTTILDIIKHRTHQKNPFDTEAVTFISEIAGGNPRKTLEYCEKCAQTFVGKEGIINRLDAETVFRQYIRQTLPIRQVEEESILPKTGVSEEKEGLPKTFLTAPTEEVRQEIRQNVRQTAERLPTMPKKGFSPLQKAIIEELKNMPEGQTLRNLSLKLGKTRGSIGKELSRLASIGVVTKMKQYGESKRYNLKTHT